MPFHLCSHKPTISPQCLHLANWGKYCWFAYGPVVEGHHQTVSASPEEVGVGEWSAWGWGEGVFIHPELFLTLSQFPDYFIPLFLHL